MTTAHAETTTTLAVTGMTCGHCVRHVEGALTALPGVTAEVDLDAATATVRHPSGIDMDAVLGAIEEAGYTAEPVRG
ncbi:hypothetical protein BJF78_13730 [Pseudonocardia sp. CNS-139]|nr:hypothetical protein BJF78_13730 [Pseudonocardia sp. CNS-139]